MADIQSYIQSYDKFEYSLVDISGYSSSKIINILNDFGNKGWELMDIKVTDYSGKNNYVLKRKITTTKL